MYTHLQVIHKSILCCNWFNIPSFTTYINSELQLCCSSGIHMKTKSQSVSDVFHLFKMFIYKKNIPWNRNNMLHHESDLTCKYYM